MTGVGPAQAPRELDLAQDREPALARGRDDGGLGGHARRLDHCVDVLERRRGVVAVATVHAARLPYAALEHDGLDLGTGAVEGAVRHLVALRLDGPGMRWGRDRAEAVLQLRCVVLNGLWDAFVASWRAAPLVLAPQPAPARAYLAPANEAA